MLHLAGPVVLRPFVLADAGSVEPWLVGPGLSVPPGQASRDWPQRLLANARIVARIGDVGGRSIGFLRLDCGPDHIAELTLVVAPECRRLGYGGRMLQEALRDARNRGMRRIDAIVHVGNQSALQFFLAQDFERVGSVGNRLRLSRLLHAAAHAVPLDVEL